MRLTRENSYFLGRFPGIFDDYSFSFLLRSAGGFIPFLKLD